MTAPAASPGPGGGGLPGRVLDFASQITTWRRAAITLFLGAGALFGTIVYRSQDRIIAAFEELVRTPATIRLHPGLADAVAHELIAVMPHGPSLVLIFSVALEANERRLVAAAVAPEHAALLTDALLTRLRAGLPLLRLGAPGVNRLVIGILNGDTPCGDPLYTPSEARVAELFHVGFVCMVGVPPEVGQLVGAIVIGWPDPPADDVLELSRPAMIRASNALAGRGKGE
jgi:hypothetical protein